MKAKAKTGIGASSSFAPAAGEEEERHQITSLSHLYVLAAAGRRAR